MIRALFALAVGVVGLGMMGCATGVDDPPEAPPTPVVSNRNPPNAALSDDLRLPRRQDSVKADNTPDVAMQLPQAGWPIPEPPPVPAEN